MGLINGFTKGNPSATRSEHKHSLSSQTTHSTHGLDDSDEVMIGVLSRKMADDGSIVPVDTESDPDDSPRNPRAVLDVDVMPANNNKDSSSSAAPPRPRPSLADGANPRMVMSQRWAPKSIKKGGDSSAAVAANTGGDSGNNLNRRAAFGKMKSTSNIFSSFRKKSVSSDHSYASKGSFASNFSSKSNNKNKNKRPSSQKQQANADDRRTSYVSNLSCESFGSMPMPGSIEASERSDASQDFLAFLEEVNAKKTSSIKEETTATTTETSKSSSSSSSSSRGGGSGKKQPMFREPLTENSHSSTSSRDASLPTPLEGLCRPRANSGVYSSASSVGSFTDEFNACLDIEASPAVLDSKAMLENLGPSPTPQDLANVAAVCANEYINEHLFANNAEDNNNGTCLDRKKWESIPQYSKSELVIRKHLGKGSFSDAFEVSVMVEVEEESKKLDSSDRDDLDRRLEAKFKGSFKREGTAENLPAEENIGAGLTKEEEPTGDLDDMIDSMFGNTTTALKNEPTPAKKVTIQEPDEFQPAQVAPRKKKVSIEDLTDFQPSAPPPPRSANNRRMQRRRQTVDLGGRAPNFSASICMGNVNKASLDNMNMNKTSARVVKKKQMMYAMKCLRPQIRSDAEQFIIGVEDLVHETAMLASLNHPNIIKLHGRAGSGVEGPAKGFRLSDGYFILIDRLQDTLDDRIKGWKAAQNGGAVVPTIHQVKAAHKLAGALAYLHSKRIIFRDLKPGNVGFDSMGEMKLFDFGFATGLPDNEEDEDRPLTEVCGTPRYMAPEVALGGGYGLSADVHSFAMLMWEICSLKKPFAKIKSQSDFRKTVYERGGRPKISKYWSPILKDTLSNSWSSFPGERPVMEDIKNTLGSYIKEMSTQQKKKGHHSGDLRKSSVFRRISVGV